MLGQVLGEVAARCLFTTARTAALVRAAARSSPYPLDSKDRGADVSDSPIDSENCGAGVKAAHIFSTVRTIVLV